MALFFSVVEDFLNFLNILFKRTKSRCKANPCLNTFRAARKAGGILRKKANAGTPGSGEFQ
jgi:hypothetical protein